VIPRPLLIDAGIAVLVAALVVIISPGWAITGVLALLVLLVCGITWLIGRLRRRSHRYGRQPAAGRRR
jgi:membrane protein YdbS with pleckstrin-like domain